MNAEYVERQLEKASSLTAREKCLIALTFGGEMTDETFHTLTDSLDLDTANQNYLLMLSCLGFAKGWERFSPDMVPRLKGVHRYHQVNISMGIPWLVQQIRRLTDEGIPVMLLKGLAVKAYYAPDRPRIMNDYDFAVPEEQFERALELLLDNGNVLATKAEHSISLNGNRYVIDLHRWVFKMHNEKFSDIWKRSETFHFHGVNVCVLAQEDMFIHLLDTRSRDYFLQANPTRRMQWLYDCRDIWAYSEGLDLERIAIRAKELHTTSRVRMMLRLFMQCFPELIKPEEFERCFPRTSDYDKLLVNGEKYINMVNKYLSYGYNDQNALTPIRIWRGLWFEMIRYIYAKPELKWINPNMNFLRFIKDTYDINGFSDLVKRYLLRIRLFEKRKGGD